MGASYGKRAPARKERRKRAPKEGEGHQRKTCPESAPPPVQGNDEELIKPKRLLNPIKNSRTHQQVHQELKCTRPREDKTELQKVLESRRRDQMIRQRKQEDEARQKLTPLETELKKRRERLEEQEKIQQEALTAPEFLKVRENLRRTSMQREDPNS